MDSETYTMSELILEDEWKGKVKPGQDCLLMSVLGKVKLMQVTGGD
jgi:translation elongation factor P/translation initiation factor 5A